MKLITSFFYSFGTKLLSLLITLISRILIARMLGPSNLGSLGSALNFTTIISRWGSLGIAPAIQFTSSKYPGCKNIILVYAVVISIIIGFLNLLLLTYFNSEIRDWQFSMDSSGSFVYSKFLPCMPLIMLSMTLPIFLLGSGQIRKYSLTQIIPLLFQTLILAGTFSKEQSFETIILAQIGNWVFTVIIALAAIGYKPFQFRHDSALLLIFTKYALHSWPQTILQFGISRFAVLIGSQYLGTKDLGYYILASNLSEAFLLLTTSLSPLIFNRIASQGTNLGLLAKTIRVINTMLLFALLVTALVGKPVFLFFFGVEFDRSWKLMLLLIVAVFFQGMIRICINYIAALGKNVAVSGILLVQITVLFALGIMACPHLGTAGLCYASITASIVGFVLCIHRVMKFNMESELKIHNILLINKTDILDIYQALRKMNNT